MLKENTDISFISKVTGLSEKQCDINFINEITGLSFEKIKQIGDLK